jgi:hypothetical protein
LKRSAGLEFFFLKIFPQMLSASFPETRITAIAPVPGGVDSAQMVSLFSGLFTKTKLLNNIFTKEENFNLAD